MKKIINGKKYDTDTATQVAHWWNQHATMDFRFCAETLYRKKNGEYFLYGEGGAMSKYATSCGDNSRCGGEDITPIDEADARKWVELHANYKYEEIFGEVEE